MSKMLVSFYIFHKKRAACEWQRISDVSRQTKHFSLAIVSHRFACSGCILTTDKAWEATDQSTMLRAVGAKRLHLGWTWMPISDSIFSRPQHGGRCMRHYWIAFCNAIAIKCGNVWIKMSIHTHISIGSSLCGSVSICISVYIGMGICFGAV